jgi:hypothetical protein
MNYKALNIFWKCFIIYCFFLISFRYMGDNQVFLLERLKEEEEVSLKDMDV